MRLSALSTAGIAAALLTLAGPTSAHTWLEQIMRIKNGKYVGPIGYSRNYMPRNATGFADTNAQHKILVGAGQKITNDTTMCRSDQTMNAYTDQYPQLSANKGDWIALTYMENGHTTLKIPTKPANGGTVFVYGTTNPRSAATEMLNDIHLVWNAEGTGGDGRGRLLATRNFDNGICHEANGGAESQARKAASGGLDVLLCQTDVQLPNDLPEGNYTLYWVWDWPELDAGVTIQDATGTEPLNERATTEMYTTCLDIMITAGTLQDTPNPIEPANTMADDADPKQMNTTFQVTKYIESLVATNNDGRDTPEISASSANPQPTEIPSETSTQSAAKPTTTKTSEESTTTKVEGDVVTVTDIVTLSLPAVVTQTISIGQGVTTTLPVLVPTDGTTISTKTKASSTGSEGPANNSNAASETESSTGSVSARVEPTPFLPGAKFRRAPRN